MNEEQNFFKFLKYSNELKKNKESLYRKDPEAFTVLLKFLVAIENNLQYSEKQEYIELAKDFLTDQITADDFSYSFMAIYHGISRKVGQMARDESLELANFLKPPRPELGDLLARIDGSCDSFGLTLFDEKELKDYAQILLLKLQEE